MNNVYPEARFQVFPARQRGAVTLFVALMVLALITIMTIYTASVGVMDQRMSGNEYRHREAAAAAEAGLSQAVAYLKARPALVIDQPTAGWTWSAGGCRTNLNAASAGQPCTELVSNLTVNASTGAQVQWARVIRCTQALVSAECPNPNNGATTWTYFVFRAQGVLPDSAGDATAAAQQQLGMAAFIGGNSPAAPMTAAGTTPFGGNFNVVANPDGGGPGVPISVWTPTNVDTAMTGGGGSMASCQLPGFNGQMCASDKLTTGNPVSTDVVQNDKVVSQGGNFPDDVFAYFFGVAATSWQTVYNHAQAITDCGTLGPTSVGLYWYTGAQCSIAANVTVGAAADDPATPDLEGPVVLVVQDANFQMAANSVINGVVVIFATPGVGFNPVVQLNGGPVVNGAFISNADLSTLNGTYTVKYDKDIMDQLNPSGSGGQNQGNSYLAPVPGSFRDF